MFLLVLACIAARLEVAGHLDKGAFLQQFQLGAVGLGANLDVLQG